MTRFDDLGLAGYERGTGYRPGGGYRPVEWTLRGFVRASVVIALLIAATWLLWDIAGERVARSVAWLTLGAGYVWRGWHDRYHPLAGDEYATDEEREKVRRESVWTFVIAASWVAAAAAVYVLDLWPVR